MSHHDKSKVQRGSRKRCSGPSPTTFSFNYFTVESLIKTVQSFELTKLPNSETAFSNACQSQNGHRGCRSFFNAKFFQDAKQTNVHWENYSLHFGKENNLTSMIQILRSGTFKSQQSTLRPTFHHKQMIQVPCSLDFHCHSIPAKSLVQLALFPQLWRRFPTSGASRDKYDSLQEGDKHTPCLRCARSAILTIHHMLRHMWHYQDCPPYAG